MAGEFEQDERGIESESQVRATADGAKEKVRAASRDLLDQAVEKKDELKERANSALDEQRTGAATRVDAISRALHGAASSLRDSGEDQLSGWVEQAAGQVERVVGYLQGQRTDGMAHDLEDFAKRNPALFLGGTYVAGLALGRFLRATSPEAREPSSQNTLAEQHRYGSAEPAVGFDGAGVKRGPGREATGAAERVVSGLGESGWSGVGVAPGAFSGEPVSDTGGVRSGAGATGPTRSPADDMRGSSEAGDGEPGLTDEDPREAWHGQQEPERNRGYGASGGRDVEGTDTGELTRYTNGDHESPHRGV